MARHWGLPPTLTNSLQVCTPQDGIAPRTHGEWLRMAATAATECARVLHAAPADAGAGIGSIVEVFAGPLGLEASAMQGAIRNAMTAAQEHFAQAPAALVKPMSESDRQARMLRGFRELQEAAKSASLPEMLGLALEFLHGNFVAKRSFCFLLFAKDKRYRARYGLGEGAGVLLPGLQFDDRQQADVFQAVLPSDRPLFIENTRAANLGGKLPQWWLDSLGNALSFCIIPLHLNTASVGFIYIDWVPPQSAPRMDIARIRVLTQVRSILVAHIARPRAA
jgi:hypothetical protein